MREIRYCFAFIVLPAIASSILFALLLRNIWRDMWSEEQHDLDVHAELAADTLMACAHAERQTLDEMHSAGHILRKHTPGHLKLHPWTPDLIEELERLCQTPNPAIVHEKCIVFAVEDMDGRRIASIGEFPANPLITGTCHVGPPLGDGTIVAAHADGGAAMRSRMVVLTTVGVLMLVLILAATTSGGFLLVHMIRHERRDARRKTDFIDNISHEFKTPLAGIRLNAELLSLDSIEDPDRRRGAAEAIVIETDRLTLMVDKLLDMSRLEKGRFHYDIETFNLADFVRAPAKLQAIDAISNGRARVRFIGPGAFVSADVNAIRQIGINLVTNAVKYSEGEIEVEVAGNELRYMDRGAGLAPEEASRVFNRFWRADNSLVRRTGGLGIGLALARTMARDMGGELDYSPRPGGGSVFTLKLKKADDAKKKEI